MVGSLERLTASGEIRPLLARSEASYGDVRNALPRCEASSGSGGSPVIGKSISPRFGTKTGLFGLPRKTLMGRTVILGSFVLALMLTLTLTWPRAAPPPSSTVHLRARTIKEQEAKALQRDQPAAFSDSAKWFQSAASSSKASAAAAKKTTEAENLVIYTYSNSDPEYERNLIFFVQHAMWEGDGCDYLIIVQQGEGVQEGSTLPKLPPNARYTFHENKCYDWGTFGWAMETQKADPAKYKYIIFMNSSVRGPFLPPYWPDTLHWSHVLTSKINDQVKIVGATISCESSWLGGNKKSTVRHNPHVQSYFMATDQVGMAVLQSAKEVFQCYEDMADTIYYSEVGSSLAILNAGYTLDSLMLRYKGIDWRNNSNWSCNNELNPYAEYAYDGITLNPMEVIFPKVKGFHLDGEWTTPRMAVTYDKWMTHQGETGSINSNDYSAKRSYYRLGKMLVMSRRGNRCFDAVFYRQRNRDLPGAWSDGSLWIHFVHDGQFEGRPFRFTCPSPFLGSDDEVTAALAAAMSQPEASVDAALQNLKAEKAAAEAAAQHAAAEAAEAETADGAVHAEAAAQTLARREEAQRQLSAVQEKLIEARLASDSAADGKLTEASVAAATAAQDQLIEASSAAAAAANEKLTEASLAAAAAAEEKLTASSSAATTAADRTSAAIQQAQGVGSTQQMSHPADPAQQLQNADAKRRHNSHFRRSGASSRNQSQPEFR